MIESVWQTLVEMDTGGDCFVKQVVDVFLLSLPNEDLRKGSYDCRKGL